MFLVPVIEDGAVLPADVRVKFNVAMLSHPTELVVSFVYVPLDVYVNPFHK
jgi:hypothetical protein